jgi:hypothetical protein
LFYVSIYTIPQKKPLQKIIEASQRMIRLNSQGELGGINPVIRRHFELQIKTFQNAPKRDADKLERLLQVKRKTKGRGSNVHGGHTERLVTEERLKCSRLYCVWW